MQASPALCLLLITPTATAPWSLPVPTNADHIVTATTARSLCTLYNRGVFGAMNAAFQQCFSALSPARISGASRGYNVRLSQCCQRPLFYEQMSPR